MRLDEDPEEGDPPAPPKPGANGLEAAAEPANFLQIGQDPRGCWVVRDRLGLQAGIFRSYVCALRFAKMEAAAKGLAIVAAAEPVEFNVD
jgi:hypothetical protein